MGSEMCIRDSSKVGDLLSSCDDSVVIGAHRIDPKKSLWAAGLREGEGLTITRIASLSVSVEGGRACRVFVSL